jgi:hypothetical protein
MSRHRISHSPAHLQDTPGSTRCQAGTAGTAATPGTAGTPGAQGRWDCRDIRDRRDARDGSGPCPGSNACQPSAGRAPRPRPRDLLCPGSTLNRAAPGLGSIPPTRCERTHPGFCWTHSTCVFNLHIYMIHPRSSGCGGQRELHLRGIRAARHTGESNGKVGG